MELASDGPSLTLASFLNRYYFREFGGTFSAILNRSTWSSKVVKTIEGVNELGKWVRYYGATGIVYMVLIESPTDVDYWIHSCGSGRFTAPAGKLDFALSNDKQAVVINRNCYDLSNGVFFRVTQTNGSFVVSQEGLDTRTAKRVLDCAGSEIQGDGSTQCGEP